MGIVLVGTTKGGTGKSTLCTNLAAMRAKGGHKVLIIDTDAQTSALKWCRYRAEDNVEPRIVSVSKRGRIVEDVLAMGDVFETVLVDAGGEDSRELRQCLAIADYVLSPLQPNQYDLMSLADMARLVTEVRDATAVNVTPNIIWNRAATHSNSGDVREAISYVEALGENCFNVLDGFIKNRNAYIRSAGSGLAVTELKGKDFAADAAAEMAFVYQDIFKETFQ